MFIKDKKDSELSRIKELSETINGFVQENLLEIYIREIEKWVEELNDKVFNYKHEFCDDEKVKFENQNKKQRLDENEEYEGYKDKECTGCKDCKGCKKSVKSQSIFSAIYII